MKNKIRGKTLFLSVKLDYQTFAGYVNELSNIPF